MKKYQKIYTDFESKINNGFLPAGTKLPTDSKICQYYSVSRITVVKAMSSLMQAGLIVRKPKVGTYVALKSKNAYPFHLLVPSFANSFNIKSSHSFMAYFREKNSIGTVIHTMFDLDYISMIVDQLNKTGTSGIALYPSSNSNNHKTLLEILNKARFNVVIGYRELNGFKGVQIINDEGDASRQAVNHLVSLGHKKIAFVGIELSEKEISNYLRYDAFQKACANTGLKKSECPYIKNLDIASLHTLKDLFTSPNAPTAIVALSEYQAISIFDILTSFSIKIPDDIALVTLDGGDKSISSEVPFTSVDFPGIEIGKALAEHLYLSYYEEEKALNPGIYEKKANLIIRNSCGKRYKYRHRYISY